MLTEIRTIVGATEGLGQGLQRHVAGRELECIESLHEAGDGVEEVGLEGEDESAGGRRQGDRRGPIVAAA
jgi:hypothetical protein